MAKHGASVAYEKIIRALGPVSAQEYDRSRDGAYESIFKALDGSGVGQETILQVYSYKREMDLMLASVKQSSGSVDEKRQAVQAIVKNYQAIVGGKLGNDLLIKFMTNGGSWLIGAR